MKYLVLYIILTVLGSGVMSCHKAKYLNASGAETLSADERTFVQPYATDSLYPSCGVDWDDDIVWECLGPFDSKNSRMMHQGRIDALSMHPEDHQEILAGAHNGGLWLTTDGGATWTNTTDDEGYSIVGVHDIVRHPADPEIVYAATNTGLSHWNSDSRDRGIGVLVSMDGGRSWRRSGYQTDFSHWMSACHALAIDPRSTPLQTALYVASEKRVWRWHGDASAQGEWESIFHDSRTFNGPAIYGTVEIHDLEVNRHGDVFMANFLGLYRMPWGENGFNMIDQPLPDEVTEEVMHKGKRYDGPIKRIYDIEINDEDHLCVLTNYYYYKTGRGGTRMVYKPYFYSFSSDWGETWTPPQRTPTTGHIKPQLAVHATNPRHIYFESASRRVVRSTDGGRTVERMKTGRSHVDVRCMEMLESGTSGDGVGDVLLVGNDGGVAMLDSNVWHDKTGEGMVLTNYFGLDIFPTDTPMVLLGAQDGSINYLLGDEWYPTAPGGDNGDCLFNADQPDRAYQGSNGRLYVGTLQRERYRGRSIGRIYRGLKMFPMAANPLNPDEVFVGGRALFRTEDEGQSYDTLRIAGVNKMINAIHMSPADTNRVFYVVRGHYWDDKKSPYDERNVGGIFCAERSRNGGWTVRDITSDLRMKCTPAGECGLKVSLAALTVDPNNAHRLWVAMAGFDRMKKVYHSEDGGISWINVSDCLPNVPMTAIMYVPGTRDGILVGSEYGVYYRDASMTEWIRYGVRGPQCMVTDMVYHPGEKQAYIATLGRGLWRVRVGE